MMGSPQTLKLPQNQMINQQLFNSLYGGAIGQQNGARIGLSRKRTNYVTSDSYFPNYE